MTLKERVLEQFNERAAIMQHDGEMEKRDAEIAAIDDLASIHGDWVREFLVKELK